MRIDAPSYVNHGTVITMEDKMNENTMERLSARTLERQVLNL